VTTYDCVIVGGGPAGLSASIYLARYNRSAIVIDHGSGRSTTHEVNENYLGFPDGIASRELRELGRRQAERFGVSFADAKIDDVRKQDGMFIAASDGIDVRGRTLIVATGVKDNLPEIENEDIQAYFGKSLFWCITCDGYKVRDRSVVLVGANDECATTALQFLNFTDRLTIVTNTTPGAHQITADKQRHLATARIPIVEGRLTHIYGDDGMMKEVELDTGQRLGLDSMFNQQGARPNSLLARCLGVETDKAGYIKADNEQRTNVPLVFAAGDVTKAFAHQVVTAAHEGATAGTTANYELYAPEQRAD
jgi:thioredoxin reductase (NADPH)